MCSYLAFCHFDWICKVMSGGKGESKVDDDTDSKGYSVTRDLGMSPAIT